MSKEHVQAALNTKQLNCNKLKIVNYNYVANNMLTHSSATKTRTDTAVRNTNQLPIPHTFIPAYCHSGTWTAIPARAL